MSWRIWWLGPLLPGCAGGRTALGSDRRARDGSVVSQAPRRVHPRSGPTRYSHPRFPLRGPREPPSCRDRRTSSPRIAKPFYDGNRRSVNQKYGSVTHATSASPSRRGDFHLGRATAPRVYPRRRRGQALTLLGGAAPARERRSLVFRVGKRGWLARLEVRGASRSVAKPSVRKKAPECCAGRRLSPAEPRPRIPRASVEKPTARRKALGCWRAGRPLALAEPKPRTPRATLPAPAGPRAQTAHSGWTPGFAGLGSAAEAVRACARRCCPAQRGRVRVRLRRRAAQRSALEPLPLRRPRRPAPRWRRAGSPRGRAPRSAAHGWRRRDVKAQLGAAAQRHESLRPRGLRRRASLQAHRAWAEAAAGKTG